MMQLVFMNVEGVFADIGLRNDGTRVRLPAKMTHSADSLTAAEHIATACARAIHLQSTLRPGSLQWDTLEDIATLLKTSLTLLDEK